MNSKFFLTIALSLVFTACSAAPQSEQTRRNPAAVFENGSLLIGTQRVELGTPFNTWTAALGSSYRFANPEIRSMIIWDDLGVAVYTDSTKERHVKSVSFVLRRPLESSGEYEPPGQGAQPLKTFSGAISFSQTPVDKMTRVEDIPKLSAGVLEVHCSQGIALCSANRTDSSDFGYSFYLSVDDQRYRSHIYNLNIAKASQYKN
ncbi:hypothetical protein ACODUL_01065 [Stenotrophomonas maltophilia]